MNQTLLPQSIQEAVKASPASPNSIYQTFLVIPYNGSHSGTASKSNPCLTGVQKLNYLRAQLQGEAAKVVAGFPLTNANYEHSVTLLTERYGQTHKLVQAHMQALLDLPSPNNSLTSLKLFRDSTESHMRSLLSLGKSSDSYGALLVPIILGKLPTDMKKNLARDHENGEWTISDLQSAILKEIHILELGI